MKSLISTVCLTFCLLALVVGASAQQTLNFANLPLVNTPSPMPNGYGQLNWGNNLITSIPTDGQAQGPASNWDRRAKTWCSLALRIAGWLAIPATAR